MLKYIGGGLIVLVLLVGFIGWGKYQDVFSPNVPDSLENDLIQIPSNTSFSQLVNILSDQKIIEDTNSFTWVADQMKFKKPVMRAGQFKIKSGSSNVELIRHLRNGKQTPVKVIINNERFIGEIISKVAPLVEPDSLDFMNLVNDSSYLSSIGYQPETFISMFIPNTYEFYWNVTPKEFFERLKKENEKFWSKNDRLQKAENQGLNKEEVYTLASIIQRETNSKPELPIIAGLYLNRLEKDMLLQADPTVVFANNEFGLRRVLNKHLKKDSPYNTYLYKGLPPGPISMASIAAIDGVLNKKSHDYIFFCAKPDNSGTHAFAKTLAGHNANARKFHRWLNKRGIR